jgi:hypothetical protein
MEQWGMAAGAAVIVAVALSYAVAMRLAPRAEEESRWNA